MDELYEYKGQQFTYSQLQEKYGDRVDDAISRLGFTKITQDQPEVSEYSDVQEYEFDGQRFSYDQLQEKYGDRTDEAIEKYMTPVALKKKEAGVLVSGGDEDFTESTGNSVFSDIADSPNPNLEVKTLYPENVETFELKIPAKLKQAYKKQREDATIERDKLYAEIESEVTDKVKGAAFEEIISGDADFIDDDKEKELDRLNRIIATTEDEYKKSRDTEARLQTIAYNSKVENELQPEFSIAKMAADLSKEAGISLEAADRNIKEDRFKQAVDMLPSSRSKQLWEINSQIKLLEKKVAANVGEDGKDQAQFYSTNRRIYDDLAKAKIQRAKLMKNAAWWRGDDDNTPMFDKQGNPVDKDYIEKINKEGKESFIEEMRDLYRKYDQASSNEDEFTKLWSDKQEKYLAIKDQFEKAQKANSFVEGGLQMFDNALLRDAMITPEQEKREEFLGKQQGFWKEKLTEAKMDFQAINEIMLTNVDPSSLKRRWYQSLATGIKQGVSLGKYIPETNRSQIAEIYKSIGDEQEFDMTQAQVANAKLSLGDEGIRTIGNSIPVMAEIIATTMLTRGRGTPAAVTAAMRRLESLSRLKYGRLGQNIFNFVRNATAEGIAYELAPSEDINFAMGVGENVGQSIFDQMERKLGAARNPFIRFMGRIAAGSISETSAEYFGDFTSELSKNGWDIETAVDNAIGRDADERARKLYLTLIATSTFSVGSNMTRSTVEQVRRESKALPKSEAKEKIVSMLDEIEERNKKVDEEAGAAPTMDEALKEEVGIDRETPKVESKDNVTIEGDVFDAEDIGEDYKEAEQIADPVEEVVAPEPEITPEPDAVEGVTAPEPEPEVETDKAERQKLENAITEGESLLKSGKKSDGKKRSQNELKVIQKSVDAAKTKLGIEPETPKAKPIISENKSYQMRLADDGSIEVLTRSGKPAKLSDATKAKYQAEYLRKADLANVGETVINENSPAGLTQDQVVDKVLSDSTSPFEIAQTLLTSEFPIENDPKTEAIANTLNESLAKIDRTSFEERNGYVSAKEGVSQKYFTKGKERGIGLDVLVKTMNEEFAGGENVNETEFITEQDVIDFILENKKPTDAINQKNAQELALEQKFEEVTGAKPTPDLLNDIVDNNSTAPEPDETIDDEVAEDGLLFENVDKSIVTDKAQQDHTDIAYRNNTIFEETIRETTDEQRRQNAEREQFLADQAGQPKENPQNFDDGRAYDTLGHTPSPIPKNYNSIPDTFQEQGQLDFMDAVVNDAQDVADLFIAYRSPRVEKSHTVYVKNGRIVQTNALTLGSPYVTSSPHKMDVALTAKRLGADKVYLLHNHPSGDPTPSDADIEATVEIGGYMTQVGVEIEHVVTNALVFSKIDGNGNVTQDKLSKEAPKLYNHRPRLESQEEVVNMAKALNEGGVQHTIVYRDSNGRVAGWEPVTPDAIHERVEGSALAFNLKHYGATTYIILTDGTSPVINTYGNPKIVKENRLDFITVVGGKTRSMYDDMSANEMQAYADQNPLHMPDGRGLTFLWEKPSTYKGMKDAYGSEIKSMKKLWAKAVNAKNRLVTNTDRAQAIRKELRDSIDEFFTDAEFAQMNAAKITQLINTINTAFTPKSMEKARLAMEEMAFRLKRKDIRARYKARNKPAQNTKALLERQRQRMIVDARQMGKQFLKQKITPKNINGIKKGELQTLYNALSDPKLTPDKISALAQRMENLFYNLESRVVMNKINNILGRNFTVVSSGRVKANLTTAEGAKIFNGIKTVLNEYVKNAKGTRGAVRQFTNEVFLLERQQELSDLMGKGILSENEQGQAVVLSVVSGLLQGKLSTDPKARLESLSETLASIEEIYIEHRSRYKAWVEGNQKEQIEFNNRGTEVTGKDPDTIVNTLDQDRKARKSIFSLIVNSVANLNFGGLVGDFRAILDTIDRKGGKNTNESWAAEVMDKVIDMTTRRDSAFRMYAKEIKTAQRRIFGKPLGKVRGKTKYAFSDKIMNTILSKEITIKEVMQPTISDTGQADFDGAEPMDVSLSRSQALYLWMHYKNEQTHGAFESKGYTPEFMAEIDKQLTPKAKEYGVWLFDFYDKFYDHVNPVYKAMYGVNMGKVENYAGRLKRQFQGGEETGSLMDGFLTSRTTAGGSTKERIKNNAPIDAIDVNQSLQSYVYEMEHFVQFAQYHRRFKNMLGSLRFKNAVSQTNKHTGDALLSGLSWYVENEMEKGGLSYESNKQVDWLMSNTVKATLAIKPKIGVTQMLSIPNAIKFLPSTNKEVALGAYLRPDKMVADLVYLIKNSEYLKNRYSGETLSQAISGLNNPELASALNSTSTGSSVKQFARVYNKMLGGLMLNVKGGDFVGVTGSVPVFTAWKAEYKRQGLSAQVALEKAMVKFQSAVEQAQQGQTNWTKSKTQKDKIGKVFSMYATATLQNYRNATSSYRELSRGIKGGIKGGMTGARSAMKGSVARHIFSVANFAYLQPMAYTFLANRLKGGVTWLLGDDDEATEEEKAMASAMILRNTNAIPYLGSIAQFAMEKPVLGKEHSFGGFLKSPVVELGLGITDLYDRADGTTDEEKKEKAWSKFRNKLSEFGTGVPASTINSYIDLFKNYNNYQEDVDLSEIYWVMAGWSRWQFDQALKEAQK